MRPVMIPFVLSSAVAFAAAGPDGAARAQESYSPAPTPYGFEQAYPYYGYGWGYGASTAEEGVARGLADLIRSSALSSLLAAEAARQAEAARRQYIENYARAVKTYYEIRQQAAAQRQKEHDLRHARVLSWLSRRRAPDGPSLSESQLDRETGELRWPKALLDPSYAAHRRRVEKLLAAKAAVRSWRFSAEEAEMLREAANTMLYRLKQQVRRTPPADYLLAKRFLEGLLAETTDVES